MRKREPIVASRLKSADLGRVLTVPNSDILKGSTVIRISVNCRSHRDGVIIDGLSLNVGDL
jgi:hypothetical protein